VDYHVLDNKTQFKTISHMKLLQNMSLFKGQVEMNQVEVNT